MSLRFPIAVGLGLLTTFGLFWVMQALVGVSGELKEGRASPKVEFVRLKRDSAPETKQRETPRRQKPEQQPPPPEMNLAKNVDPGEAVGEIASFADTSAELAEAVAAGGRVTSIPASFTKDAVTMKKINMMNTTSSIGVRLTSLSSLSRALRRRISPAYSWTTSSESATRAASSRANRSS
jgi:hypothetical protein